MKVHEPPASTTCAAGFAPGKLLVQQWSWVGDAARDKQAIEEELGRFEKFQLAPAEDGE